MDFVEDCSAPLLNQFSGLLIEKLVEIRVGADPSPRHGAGGGQRSAVYPPARGYPPVATTVAMRSRGGRLTALPAEQSVVERLLRLVKEDVDPHELVLEIRARAGIFRDRQQRPARAPPPLASPIDRLHPLPECIGSPIERIGSPVERIAPPVERLESPVERITSRVERIASLPERVVSLP